MMLYNLLSKTDRAKFTPVVISMMDRGIFADRIEQLDVPVHTLGMKAGLPGLDSVWRLNQLLTQLKPQVIQSWMYHANILAQITGLFSGNRIPVLWGIHHSIASLSSEKKLTIALVRLGALLSSLPAKIVFVSQSSQQQHESLGYDSGKSTVIPNGFDTELFKPAPEIKSSVRAELGLPADSFTIGLVGRYHPMKDHANFLNAASMLHQHHPQARYLLIGSGADKNNSTLVAQVEAHNLDGKVYLLGQRDDISRLTASLDICSLSSAYGEAFPLVVGEAMSCEVPCVVTDVGDSAWIVGDAGRVVPIKNPQALAAAWQELLELDPPSRAALGQTARQRVVSDFSLVQIVDRYEQLYTQFAR